MTVYAMKTVYPNPKSMNNNKPKPITTALRSLFYMRGKGLSSSPRAKGSEHSSSEVSFGAVL